MIQDIYPHIFNNEYRPSAPSPKDCIWIFDKRDVLVLGSEGDFTVPTYGDLCRYDEGLASKLTYLFKIDDVNAYLLMDSSSIPEGVLSRINTSVFRTLEPKWLGFMGATSRHLWSWYMSNRFCGCCGGKMLLQENARAVYCPDCGKTVHPSIAPVIMVGITNGDKLLVTHYPNKPKRRYSLVAGYVEIGETLEDTVKREVMEEVGLKVKNITYYTSQPWPFTGTLMSGFYAEVDGDDNIKVDYSELADAYWIRYDEIPEFDTRLSLAQDMIQHFKKALNKREA